MNKTDAMARELRGTPLPYRIWGKEHIDDGTLEQMDAAMRLPVSVGGALMPDAHVGYGLPIGGVLATEGVVIPYAVGVDIACRMRLSIFPEAPALITHKIEQFKKTLERETHFGRGASRGRYDRQEHAVLDDPDWSATKYLQSLQSTAYEQLGTSGTGNHFVEWGSFRLREGDAQLGLAAGEYLALLSHSGSRGVGFKIANKYSKLAMELHPELDRQVRHLAWLPLDTESGQEYWIAMQLAGRFAAANHEVIHRRLAKATGLRPLVVVENHHNFAWRERIPAPPGSHEPKREVIIHRKGATPAGVNTPGVIPGSMADAGYVVRGLGSPESLYSAAHGAGRQMSRRAAKNAITRTELDRYLRKHDVTLIGGGLDEAPQAYKSIEDVIAAQRDLVTPVGQFVPRIVRMAKG